MSKRNILVVDDERDIRELIREILEDEGYAVETAADGNEAQQAMSKHRPDLVLLDVWLPDIDGLKLLKLWAEKDRVLPPIIMISGHGNIETAVEATRLGAYDFLEKPLTLAKLLLTVEHALETSALQRENTGLKRFSPLMQPIGNSTIMQTLRSKAKKIARHNAWVLITGAPGAGKELFARYIHANSPRATNPFVDVRAASLKGNNAQTTLFGKENNGAVHYGLLDQANNGILYLDEITDMELEAQALLLSALEGGSYLRPGGVETVVLDVRVIASSSKKLEDEIANGRFLEELYYQLNVVPLHVPSLCEHPDDIAELTLYYLKFYAVQENLPTRVTTNDAIACLREYNWPGNIREFKNLIQRLLILGEDDEITRDEICQALGRNKRSINQKTHIAININDPLRTARMAFEKAYFLHQLDAANGNMVKAAKQSGIERTHLYRKLKALNINIKDKEE